MNLKLTLEQAKEAAKKHEYRTAERLSREIVEQSSAAEMDEVYIPALLELGSALQKQGRPKELLEYSKLAIEKAEESALEDSSSWLALANRMTGVGLSMSGDFVSALEYYDKALTIYEQLENKMSIAGVNGNIGIIYYLISDYSKALTYYQKSLEVSQQIGDKSGIGAIASNIGSVYLELGEYQKSLEFQMRSLAFGEEINNIHSIAIATNNIGAAYSCMGNHKKALQYHEMAHKQYEKLGDKGGIARTIRNIGKVYNDGLLDQNKAKECFQSSLDISEEIGDKHGMATSKLYMGILLARTSYEGYNPKKAEEYMFSALDLATEIGTEEIALSIHKELAALFKRNQRWQKALNQTELYNQVLEKTKNEETKKQATRFSIEYKIQEREKEVAVERASAAAKQEATTSLLHRVLPNSIAERMLTSDEEIADYFPAVSILFADICGFTTMTSELPAYMLVRMLNEQFNRYDNIMKQHGCTKIKTIGDGYMAVAGAPEACDDHAERMVKAAIELIKPIDIPPEIAAFLPDDAALQVRVGMHTGPVVAGVVGEERFMYDIYSDAVNVASRMETTGEAGRIHVSAAFMKHLLSRFAMTNNTDHGIRFEKRGEIEVKGKGMMKTFFLCQ